MADARIAVGLPTHPKTKKLVKRLGQAGAWNLVCLILWAASNRSDGDLTGMSAEDIELAADWQGGDGEFVDALAAVRFIDGSEGAYCLHDWQEHNPWAAGAEMRSAKARWNAAKRHHGIAEADRLVPEYAAVRSATSNADVDATSKPAAEEQDAGGIAPSPSPSPSPSGLVPVASGDLPKCNLQSIVDLYHEVLPELPAVRLMTESRKKAIAKQWRFVLTSKKSDGTRRAFDADQAMTWLRDYFNRARDNDFLMGRTGRVGEHANWQCDLDFLLTEKGMKHVIEKTKEAA